MTHELVTEEITTLHPPARKPVLRKPGWLRGVLLGTICLASVCLGAWLLYGPRAKQPTPQGGRGPNAIVAATVEKGAIPITFDALGTVAPLASTTVRTQIAGQLTQIAFHEGQAVQKGHFLAQIDPRPFEFALAQFEGQLRRDQALLRTAEDDLLRYRKLAAQASISKQQAENQEHVVEQFRGTIAIDQALVDKARLDVAYCRIVAPVDGRVGLRQVDLGTYLQTGDANGIVIVTQIRPITVIFSLSQDKLPAVAPRWRRGDKLSVSVFDSGYTMELARGALTAIDNQIDPGTGTVKLRAEFPNEDEALFPNQFVNARLLVEVVQDAALAPAAAIQHGAPGDFVYLVRPDDTVTLRTVKLGPTSGQLVAIVEGLAPGDRIVVDGADRLREGARVVQPRAASTGPTNPAAAQTGG